jgi:retron-type reverse transcriptase
VGRRKTLELAWETGKKPRGRAGIDDVPTAAFEEGQEDSLALLPRKLRDGTSQPKPGKRGASANSAGGIRKRGIPAVRDRVGQQAVGQRRGASFEPTCLDRAFG